MFLPNNWTLLGNQDDVKTEKLQLLYCRNLWISHLSYPVNVGAIVAGNGHVKSPWIVLCMDPQGSLEKTTFRQNTWAITVSMRQTLFQSILALRSPLEEVWKLPNCNSDITTICAMLLRRFKTRHHFPSP